MLLPPPLEEKPPSTELSPSQEKRNRGTEGGQGVRREWSLGKTMLRMTKPAPQNLTAGFGLPESCRLEIGKGWIRHPAWKVTSARVEVPRSLCLVMNKYRTIHILILKFSDSTASLKSTLNSQRSQGMLPTFLRITGLASASRQHKPLH